MPKAIHPLFLYLTYLLVLSGVLSCTATKNNVYFQTISRDTLLRNTTVRNYEARIKPDDQLSIGIASASSELSAQFNNAQAGTSQGGASSGGYLVDKNGNIRLYKLGDVKLEGLTRDEARAKLEKELSPYLKEPVVTVRFANHRITVLGEVGSPGVQTITNDQVTVLEIIGQSGDLTEKARRDNVLVIRQTESGKEFRHLNLSDHSIFTSPYFYLQNEDVVYVEPDPSKDRVKLPQLITYALAVVSLITILTSRF